MGLNIVLYEPEIPQNTCNIMRTCAGTDTVLHLIEPLGFIVDEEHLKRSCANYYQHVKYFIYKNWEEFKEKNPGEYVYLTRYGFKSPDQYYFSKMDTNYYLVLGKESSGIPKEILKDNLENCIRIPTNDKIRSLNLSNCVNVILFEALRQRNYEDLSRTEPDSLKGHDFLLK